MKEKNTQRSLLTSYRNYTRLPGIVLLGIILVDSALIVAYIFVQHIAFLIALDAISVLAFIAYIIFFLIISRKLKITFYKQIFETTYENINKIKNNDIDLLSYGESEIKEVNELDKATSDLKKKLSSSYLIVRTPEYDHLNLEYVDKEKGVITYKSFKENLANIIFVSQSFRNVLIEVFYEIPSGNSINKKDFKRILEVYRKTFSDHEKVLFMWGEDNKSLLIYVPVIDSFSEIREKLGYALTGSTVTIRDDRGIQHIQAKFAIVAYPYSTEDMMLGDLRYARREGKTFNLFLPQRHHDMVSKNLLLNSTMNVNYSSKILVELNKIDYSLKDNEKNKTILVSIFNSITDFLDIDEGGIIVFDKTYETYYSYVASTRSQMFKNKEVSKDLVEGLASVVDDDNSYYFSTKRHASGSIKRVLDLYGINSGTYFVVRSVDQNEITALVYMFNREKDLKLNTYLREMFYIVSVRLENYFDKREIADFAQSKLIENDNILALSHLYTYHVDPEYKITEISKSMKQKFPHLKLGDVCHKFFFGLEKPCRDCPLRTKAKKYFEDRGNKFETSLVLSNRKDKDTLFLVKQLSGADEIGDLFHPDLLVYSFRTLVDLIKNAYAASARGYIVLLCVDNYEQIVATKGSEGYSYYMREYIRTLKNRLSTDEIYVYNPSTLAIHFPYEGHANTINKIEKIYPLSKSNFFNADGFKDLKITYLPVGYPRGYANTENFLKHLSDFYSNPEFKRGKDYIYFADYSISRSANEREFMVDVLENEFSSHNSQAMYLQPIVSLKDERIFGAEILLRIEDAHRNIFFDARQISQIAQQEGKTQLVTESIINYIGNLYKEFGNSIFKINKFNRIAINIDETYLKDDKLIQDLITLSTKNNIPKGFISMEIPEFAVTNNKAKIKHLAEELAKNEISFTCDGYEGRVEAEELAALGFKEAKVAFKIINGIDKDSVKFDTVRTIVSACQQNNIKISVVGVENAEQAKLLRSLDENIMAQGYYYYKALSRSDFVNALISYEKQ